MQQFHEILSIIDKAIGGSNWFVFLLLFTGIFFTIYLKFPQIRYFKHAIRVVSGKYDKDGDKGDTSHFQALTTALSGTVGTGNIAGVAFAIHLGGPPALFWMLVTAALGMTTKFTEVILSHKYRDFTNDGSVSGGPMYYMKKRLNINLPNGKLLRTGTWLGILFAIATIFSSFGTGSLPQINSISATLFSAFGINKILSGAILSVLLALVIIGGIKRIAKVTSRLVPFMALVYFIGIILVLISNANQIIPAIASVFSNIFTGSAATGGFLGSTVAFAFNRGVNRGLFSNEAGQGSAPIAHAAARANEPVSEGMVAILEPFIDTIIICFLTGITILASGSWHEKTTNQFQIADIEVVQGRYETSAPELSQHIKGKNKLNAFNGEISVSNGKIENKEITVLSARSVAEEIVIIDNTNAPFSGKLNVSEGIPDLSSGLIMKGKSLIHSAPLTALAFTKSFLGHWGQYIVAIGILLFAFSTAISWSYYGDRAVTFLFGNNYVIVFRIVYVLGFFIASFTDTSIVWTFSGITIALMTIPNLIGLLILHKEVNLSIKDYWSKFNEDFPNKK